MSVIWWRLRSHAPDEPERILAMSSRRFIHSLPAPRQFVHLLRSSARALIDRGRRDLVHLAVVIPLDEVSAQFATKLQIDILRNYGRNPGLDACPHITLKLGFEVKDIAPFEAYLDQLANEISPFEIAMKNFGFFDEGIMFLDVEPSASLEGLRRRILSDLSKGHGIKAHIIEGDSFHFHVTLAYGLSRWQFSGLRETYKSQPVQIKFYAKHIDLFFYTGHHWVTLKRATLRGAPNSFPTNNGI